MFFVKLLYKLLELIGKFTDMGWLGGGWEEGGERGERGEEFLTKSTEEEKITEGERGMWTENLLFFLFFVFFSFLVVLVRTLLEKFFIGDFTYENIKFIQ